MKINKKMLIILCSVVAIILFIIILLIIFFISGDKSLAYPVIEDKIIVAGRNYLSDNPSLLPTNGTLTIDTNTLITNGYLNDLTEYTKEGVICTGNLYVTKNPNEYSYRVNLNCGSSYNTKLFKDVILNNNGTDGSNGLYEEEQVNPDDNTTLHKVYTFKGDNVKNYIKMGDFYWRIIKVYENGEVAVLGDPELLRSTWDNRFNVDFNNYRGINDYKLSRLKDNITKEVVEFSDGYKIIKSLITPHNACVGDRTLNDASRDGSSECSEILENQYFSLLPVYDFMNASLDENCIAAEDNSCFNYNYLSASNNEWWTITAVSENTQDVYFFSTVLTHGYASRAKAVRLYAHLDPNVTYVSGNGTYDNPYVLK